MKILDAQPLAPSLTLLPPQGKMKAERCMAIAKRPELPFVSDLEPQFHVPPV